MRGIRGGMAVQIFRDLAGVNRAVTFALDSAVYRGTNETRWQAETDSTKNP